MYIQEEAHFSDRFFEAVCPLENLETLSFECGGSPSPGPVATYIGHPPFSRFSTFFRSLELTDLDMEFVHSTEFYSEYCKNRIVKSVPRTTEH